jgi:hypothetical protein
MSLISQQNCTTRRRISFSFNIDDDYNIALLSKDEDAFVLGYGAMDDGFL